MESSESSESWVGSISMTEHSCVWQGKYINDPEVLRAAAEKAGVKDADQVLSDPNVARDQARTSAEDISWSITAITFLLQLWCTDLTQKLPVRKKVVFTESFCCGVCPPFRDYHLYCKILYRSNTDISSRIKWAVPLRRQFQKSEHAHLHDR
jgi:hypothetical protein